MNRFYRVVWNNKMHCWQAVSELAKRHSGNGTVSDTNKNMIKVRMCCALSTVLLTLSSSIFAAINETTLPTGQQVMSGSADFTQTGNTVNINQHTQNLSTHWNTFNIGRHATVNFNQQNQSSVALNRVLDNNASASEDFAYYGQLMPSLFVFVGATPADQDMTKAAPNHNPLFIVDNKTLKTGVESHVRFILDYPKVAEQVQADWKKRQTTKK